MSTFASQYDEIVHTAESNGLAVLHDSGEQPGTDREVVFGDSIAAADWGNPKDNAGFTVSVFFSHLDGEVDKAHVTRNGVIRGGFDSSSSGSETASNLLEAVLVMVTAPHDSDKTY